MSTLKIAIIGAGAVGGYLAAKLTQNDYDITLLVKAQYLDAIREHGLKVKDYKKDEFTVYPYSVDSLNNEIFDVVFIATKSCDYESVCKKIQNSVNKNTLIIPLSDGLGLSSTLKSHLPSCIIGDGLIYIISELTSVGKIHRKSFTFYLQIASRVENTNLKVLEQILNNSDLRTSVTKNLRYERWKKYLFTSSMSILTTYFDKSMGYIFKEQLELMIDILLEIQKVANAKGVGITNQDIEKVVKQASHVEYETKTMMQLDFENRKKTEFNSIIEYLVLEAKVFDIHIPQIKSIYTKLKEKTFN